MPEDITVPNSTKPAPPITGSGIAAITWPSTGSMPSSTMNTPPRATT